MGVGLFLSKPCQVKHMDKKYCDNRRNSGSNNRNLLPIVKRILSRKKSFLDLVNKHNTPFYVYDQEGMDEDIDRFIKSFKVHIPNFQSYYALKLNHHPLIVRHAVEKGMGLDVASVRELDIALKMGATKIVYFSPGKNESDLRYALKYADTVRIHIDSFNELHILGKLTNKLKRSTEVGIRINTPSHGLWSKYGIPLNSLRKIWKEANKYPFLKLNGIHFHQSRNRTVLFYTNTIRELAEYLKEYFSPNELKNIKYIDFGGGFEPYKSEGAVISKKSSWPKY